MRQGCFTLQTKKTVRLAQLLTALGVLLGCTIPVLPKAAPHLVYDKTTLLVTESNLQYYVTNYRIRNDSFQPIGPEWSPLVVSVDQPEAEFMAKVLSARPSNGFKSRWEKEEGRAYFPFDGIAPGDTVTLSIGLHTPSDTSLSVGPEGSGLALTPGKVESMVLIIPFALFTLALFLCILAEAAYTAWHLNPLVPDPYPEGLIRLRKQRRRERVEPRKRTRAAMLFYRHWPISFTALWALCYWLLFWA